MPEEIQEVNFVCTWPSAALHTLCTFVSMNVHAVPFAHFALSHLDYVKNSRFDLYVHRIKPPV